ncbi:MAG: hypothetical protein AB7S66_09725, partial [Sphaerochaeta sp.]
VALDCPWQTPASIYKETWGYRSWQVRGDKHEKIKELSATARRVIEGGGELPSEYRSGGRWINPGV